MHFDTLWDKYPEYEPCSNELELPYFDNQCAIKMGVALNASGFDLSDYGGEYCWHHSIKHRHILRVEELCKYLKVKLSDDTLIQRRKSVHNIIHAEDFIDEQGIVAFINFWGSGNQEDHIDLFRHGDLRNGDLDYFERSEKVLFWRIG